MEMTAYKDEILLKLGGGVLNLELDDASLERVINAAFREIQRYIDTTRLATLPYKPCIDLTDCKVSSVARVYRTRGFLGSTAGGESYAQMADPAYATQWQILNGVNGLGNIQDWVYRYGAWNQLLQIRNTLSTDLLFRFDRHTNYLYINTSGDKPQNITIEYVPRYDDVSQIVSDYWIDKLVQLATALAKTTIGRIRSRYTQSNSLWSQDGERMLEEGNAELQAIRTELKENHNLTYPID